MSARKSTMPGPEQWPAPQRPPLVLRGWRPLTRTEAFRALVNYLEWTQFRGQLKRPSAIQ